MKVKILAFSPDPNDCNSWWRAIGPLLYLQKQSGHEIEITVRTYDEDGFTWADMSAADIVFLHRPCRKQDLTAIEVARSCNVPVWIDIDDWLFDLPTWNSNLGFYGNAGTQNYIAHSIACADVVSVSTTELYSRFSAVNSQVVLIPNGYRSDLFSYRSPELAKRNPIAIWRGTNTHDGDLESVQEGFLGLKGKVHFWGSPSWSLLSKMEKGSYQTLTSQDFLQYFKNLYKQRPKMIVFPLADCLFNQCKSNIAWMEALHAGALCVAPEMPEWIKPGCITYKPGDSESFRNAVNTTFEMSETDHQEQVTQAFSYMKNRYDIALVNKIRMDVVSAMLSPTFKKNTRDPWDQLTGFWALSKLKNIPQVVDQKETGGGV